MPSWLRTSLALAGAALMAGCGTPAPLTVRVPVPVPCVTDVPPAPTLADDAALRALDDYRLVLTLARERLVLIGHAAELRAVLEACARP